MGITSKNHYRDLNLDVSVISSLVSTEMILPPTMCLEEKYLNSKTELCREKWGPRRLKNPQVTDTTMDCVEKNWSMNHQYMPHARKKAFLGTYYMSYAHISHIYNLVSIDTLTSMFKTFVTCLYK